MEWYALVLTELLGTGLLVLLGNGIVANVVLKGTKGHNAGWVAIAFGWGFAVMVAALISNALGGLAYLNPAVAVADSIANGFASVNGMPNGVAFLLVLIAEFIGAVLGQILLNFFYYKQIQKTLKSGTVEDKLSVLAMHSTIPQERSITFNFIGEFVGTAVLVLSILAFAKFGLAGSFGPFLVFAVITAIGLSLGGTTGYAINPFRDLAPRVVHQVWPLSGKGTSDWKYSWIPVVAPLCAGAIIGALFLIK